MPYTKDAPVIIAGRIISVDPLTDRETKAVLGARVLVMAGNGVATVRFDLYQLADVAPVAGTRVAWLIRNSTRVFVGTSGAATIFVRVADLGDVDLMQSIIQDSAKLSHQSSQEAA